MRGFQVILAFAIALALALTLVPVASAQEWLFSPNVQAHPADTGNHLWPDIAVSPQGVVAVAWMDDHAPGGYHIFYTASTDGGATWSVPEKVDSRTTGSYSKFVSLGFTPSGIPVAVWEDDRTGAMNVYLSRRDPAGGGAPWTAEVRVNTAGSPSSGSYFMNPSLAVLDEQRFFVAWTDWREGVFNQVYMRSTPDAGATWNAETRISDEIGYQPVAGDPCLIVDPASALPGQEVLHCVMNDWRGNVPGGRYPDVYYSRSSNGGQTWSTGVRINDVTALYQQVSSRALCLLSDGSLVSGWLNSDIALSTLHSCRSTDQGATWSPSVRVDDPALGGTDTYSAMAASGTDVFAAFGCYQGSWNLYFRHSSDGGRTWTEAVTRIDDDATGSATQNPVLAALSPTEVHAAWQDSRPGGSWKTYTSRGTRDITSVWAGASLGSSARSTWTSVPNPARVGQTVTFRPGGVKGEFAAITHITVVDASGRLVRRLPAGSPEIVWDGRDESGALAGSGVYWVRFPDRATAPVRVVRIR